MKSEHVPIGASTSSQTKPQTRAKAEPGIAGYYTRLRHNDFPYQ